MRLTRPETNSEFAPAKWWQGETLFFPFLLGFGLFSGALAGSFGEVNYVHLHVPATCNPLFPFASTPHPLPQTVSLGRVANVANGTDISLPFDIYKNSAISDHEIKVLTLFFMPESSKGC